MNSESALITAAQMRAGRGLLDWSQERLAEAAGVGLSSVRDFEKERRAGDTNSRKALRQALEQAGLMFLWGDGGLGAGVRWRAELPSVLRRPTRPDKRDALIVSIEWRGGEAEIYLTGEALDALSPKLAKPTDVVALFEAHRATILIAARSAIERGRLGPDRRVSLGPGDLLGEGVQ